MSGPDSEKTEKKSFKIFKSNLLSITGERNLIVTDFVNVTFDLKSATYYPYRKQNNELHYINKHSNHPPSRINQIPSMISNRISENSFDKNQFDNQLLITTLLLKILDLVITSRIFQVIPKVKLERDKLFGSMFHIVLM